MTVPISDAWKARLAQVSDAATRRLAVDQARQEVKRAVKGLGYNVADGNLGGILRELAEKWQITGGEYSLYDLGLAAHRAGHEREIDERDAKAAVAAFCMFCSFCAQIRPGTIVEATVPKPETGTIEVRQLPRTHRATRVVLSADGRFVAFTQYTYTATLYVLDTFGDQRILEVEDLSATWDPIAFVGSDASPEIVYLSKSSTGYRVNRRPINGEPSTAKITTPILQASPIGVIADGPGDACAYFVQGFVQHSSATAPRRVPDTVSVLRFAMNGKLIGGLGDGGVFVLDEPFLSPAIVRHHKAGIVDIRVVSPEEGLQFVSLSADGQVCLWMYTPADALTLRRDFGYVRDTAVCVGIVGVRTKRIVVLGKTGRLHVLGRSPSTLELHPKVAIDGATISQDGRMLAAIDADLQLRLWQLYET